MKGLVENAIDSIEDGMGGLAAADRRDRRQVPARRRRPVRHQRRLPEEGIEDGLR